MRAILFTSTFLLLTACAQHATLSHSALRGPATASGGAASEQVQTDAGWVDAVLLGRYPHVSDRLFCGMSIPGGGTVSDADVERFLDEVVEPRFPDGFTVWRARGQWRGGSEETLVIEIVRPRDAALEAAVLAIANEYRLRFNQGAVLRVVSPANMQFIP